MCSTSLLVPREMVDPSVPASTSEANCADDRTKVPTEWYTSKSSRNASKLEMIQAFAVLGSNTTAAVTRDTSATGS